MRSSMAIMYLMAASTYGMFAACQDRSASMDRLPASSSSSEQCVPRESMTVIQLVTANPAAAFRASVISWFSDSARPGDGQIASANTAEYMRSDARQVGKEVVGQ